MTSKNIQKILRTPPKSHDSNQAKKRTFFFWDNNCLVHEIIMLSGPKTGQGAFRGSRVVKGGGLEKASRSDGT
jgi:hypothetical protein